MKIIVSMFITLLCIVTYSCAQKPSTNSIANKRVKGNAGAPCEGCEAIYECPVPFDKLSHQLILPDREGKGRKLTVRGIVVKADGITPAPEVIVYVYHTDQTGIYPKKGDETGWGKRHGYIRGWMRTNEKGEYTFYTLRPASYPNDSIPAHIHITIKEPAMNEYWIDDYFFEDDPFLTIKERKKLDERGGNGILKLREIGKGEFVAERNIILGKNIPNYPTTR